MKYENIVKCQFSTKTEREMHFHQDIEILYVLDGSLEVEYEDGTHFLNTDQFILVPMSGMPTIQRGSCCSEACSLTIRC